MTQLQKSTSKPKIKFYRRPKWIILSVLLIAAAVGIYFYATYQKPVVYEFIEVKRDNLIQEVSVTGRVKPAETVDLALEVGGIATQVNVKIGDHVKAGDPLVVLNSTDLYAQLRQAEAGTQSAQSQWSQYEAARDSQQAKLDELKAGTRLEEIQISRTTVTNAQKSLKETEKNFETVRAKTESDLENIYQNSLTSLLPAVTAGKAALITLTDVQYAHFNSANQDSIVIANSKAEAVYALLGAVNAGNWVTEIISKEQGGAYAKVQDTVSAPTREKIDSALIDVLSALRKVKTALESVPLAVALTTTERANLDSAKITLNTQISALVSAQQSITVQKAAAQTLLAQAEASVTTGKNSVLSAQRELNLKYAGATEEQIKGQEALVRQAGSSLNSQASMIRQSKANAEYVLAQIAKRTLKAPMNGLVTRQEAKAGEMISGGIPVVTLISEENFEIEVNLPEVDVAKVELGDMASVTLDAYGDEWMITAKLIEIEPAETIVEGVPTYKTIFQFTISDERIKSGMTANVDVLTDQRENVIAIPQRATFTKNGDKGDKYVRVLTEEPDPENPSQKVQTVRETLIKTGLKASDGRVEVTEGLNEGDKVLTAWPLSK